MKIGILTYHFANNYGAVLQAYAMQHILQFLGYKTEFINFCSEKQKSNNSLIEMNTSINSCIKNIVRLPHYFERKRRINSFNDFRKNKFNLSKQQYSSVKETISFCEKNYDAIIVGSDQVWNPNVADFNDIYYTIAEANIPVYAYAVSLGNAKENILSKYKDLILKFKRISVREKASIDILKKIDSEIEAIGVIDPTLLPDKSFFEELVQKPEKKENYIACYFLGRENNIKFRKTVEQLAKIFKMNIYYINANYGITSYGRGVINDCSPQEFLGYLKNAKLVCTNSFHAVALSIQFGTPFFTFETDIKDTRKRDLLRRLNLLDRIIENFEISGINNYKMKNDIDVDKNLKYYREISIEFLKNISK